MWNLYVFELYVLLYAVNYNNSTSSLLSASQYVLINADAYAGFLPLGYRTNGGYYCSGFFKDMPPISKGCSSWNLCQISGTELRNELYKKETDRRILPKLSNCTRA
jgi:hypothetical protein